jgi:hypothetical protein
VLNNPVNRIDPSGHCFGVLGGIDTLICAGVVVFVAGTIAAVASSPNSGFNWNDYDWSDWSLPGLPIGTSAAQPPRTTLGIPLTGEEKGSNINAAKQSKQSGKEGATDVPSWAKGQKALPGEAPQTTAKRLMDEKYGEDEWEDRKGPGQEYNKLKKYYERNRNAGGSTGGDKK